MIKLLRNAFERIRQKKVVLIIAFMIMPLMVGVAIFFSSHSTSNEKIAYLGMDTVPTFEYNEFSIEVVTTMPTISQLVSGEYAAVIQKDVNGKYSVTTLKNSKDKAAIEVLFQTGKLPADYKSDDLKRQERGIATNIFGFITMLLLMQGVALTALYPEDRTNKTFQRIMTAPIGVDTYLASQLLFTFICLYVPTYGAILLFRIFFGISIGVSFGTMALLLFVLTLFATSFALFISSSLKRNINLVTSGISIVTCILAGCFIPLTTDNKVLTTIFKTLPQSTFMEMVHGLEFGRYFRAYSWSLYYLFLWSFFLWLGGIIITKKRIAKGTY